jgi:hypothetical protein
MTELLRALSQIKSHTLHLLQTVCTAEQNLDAAATNCVSITLSRQD